MLSILAAYTKKSRTIGSDGRIPWNLPSERFRFKEICAGRRVIMGRRSFEEIGHALSYCTIVILSRTMRKEDVPEGCLLARSFEEAIELSADEHSEEKLAGRELPGGAHFRTKVAEEVLVAGGEDVYRQALPFAGRVYATEISVDFPGDRVFPELPGGKNAWTKKTESRRKEQGIPYEYVTYERITPARG